MERSEGVKGVPFRKSRLEQRISRGVRRDQEGLEGVEGSLWAGPEIQGVEGGQGGV